MKDSWIRPYTTNEAFRTFGKHGYSKRSKRSEHSRKNAFLTFKKIIWTFSIVFRFSELFISATKRSLLLAGMWSRSRRLGLETVSRRTNVSSRSRLKKNCHRLGLVSVSAIYVSCPRPVFGQIVQATLTNRLLQTVCEKWSC